MDFVTGALNFLTNFRLDNLPQDLSITDTTVYPTPGGAESGMINLPIQSDDVEIIFNCFLPNGNIFYQGDPNFTPPDIDRSATATKDGIVLQLDAEGNVIQGVYEITAKYQTTNEIYIFTIQDASSDAAGAPNNVLTIRITGNYVDVVGDISLGSTIQNSANIDGATYTVDTVVYDAGEDETVVTFLLNADCPDVVDTQDLGDWRLITSRIYETTKILPVEYELPVVCILQTFDCNKSELRSQDATDYSEFAGSTLLRSHVLKYPVDLVPPLPDVEGFLEIISVSPIYTNVWTTVLNTTIPYTVTDSLILTLLVSGTKSIDVQCSDQWCTIFACLENVSRNFEQALKGGNTSEIARWEGIWDSIQGYALLYDIAYSCGNSTKADEYYQKTVDAATACNSCTIVKSTTNSPTSQLVQPLTSGGLTTNYTITTNTWLSGPIPPTALQGNDGDYYLETVGEAPDFLGEGNVYKKISGIWELQMNLKGTPGNDGEDGIDGTDGTQILAIDALPIEDDGADGDYNIRLDANIDRKNAGVWAPYADPNGQDGVAGVNGTYSIFNTNAPIEMDVSTVVGWTDVPGSEFTIPIATIIGIGSGLRFSVGFEKPQLWGDACQYRISIGPNTSLVYSMLIGDFEISDMVAELTLGTQFSDRFMTMAKVTQRGQPAESSPNFASANNHNSNWSGYLGIADPLTEAITCKIQTNTDVSAAPGSNFVLRYFRIDLITQLLP